MMIGTRIFQTPRQVAGNCSSICCTTPLLVLELVDRILKLLVENHTIGDHDHAIENALVRCIVQDASRWASQPMVLLLPLPAECSIR